MSTLTEQAAPPDPELVNQLLAGYRPLPGVHDEMISDRGEVRVHWRDLLTGLASLGREELSRRFAAADRYLRDSGVFHRVYEDEAGVERPWPLTPIPLVIAAEEWERLQAALVERAHLMEAVIADIYGAGTLFREKRLPAAFAAGSPEFLRPLVGVPPPGGAFLRIYAADVARGPDGRWWVLRDQTQAPSGAGFALENRLALRQSIPDIYRGLRVLRHAPFFQAMQAELTRSSHHDDSRICVLTPGPMNETYFEHAYLARYLGFLLVEGEDLTVRDNGVFIRTVSGLKRTEVLLRRLDADFCDPLELNARSRLGVPGLVQAVRDGKVVMANGLGSGIAEARGMLAFLPALSEAIDGRGLAIPNIATWWLGDPAMRAALRERFDDMVVAPAYFGEPPSETIGEGVVGSERRQRILQSIDERGIDLVLQEAVRLSTMPVWRNGKLAPRPFILRVFLTKHGDSFAVMPGGFVRIGDPDDVYAISLQRGALTADAWIPSRTPLVETSLLPSSDRIQIKRASGTLPSRAADNLFWLGRYMERTEATLRLLRALLARISESDRSEQDVEPITSLLRSWGAVPDDSPPYPPLLAREARDGAAIARAALQRGDQPGSMPALARAVRSAGSVIRDRLSPDAWRSLMRLAATCDAPLTAPSDFEAAMAERVEAALHIIASFSGLAQENMTRLGGWRFLDLGRRIERAIVTCRFVRQFGARLDRGLDTLLELCDSRITYRQRYLMVAARAPVIDLSLLDPSNPRSVAFQFEQIESHLAAMPHLRPDGRLSLPRQISMATAAKLRTADAARVDDRLILSVENALLHLSEAISSTFLGRNEPVEAREELPAVIYDVRQTSTCVYETAVTRARRVLRQLPVARDRQHVTAAVLDIDPVPVSRRETTDFFHNWTTVVELDEPHETLTVKLSARVSVAAAPLTNPDSSPPWESVRADTYGTEDISPSSPVHFVHPSRQVSLDPAIRDYARESFPPSRPMFAGAVELMQRIKSDFAYEPGATTVTTTPAGAFALRRGVCQDFAHIMIAGLRGLGLPAGYVSGFLRTVPPPGAVRLAGADAMHAWVLVWCGAAGWRGLDPTNALIASEDHVVLAIGRDYADVAPIDGVMLASGRQRLTTAVNVVPIKS